RSTPLGITSSVSRKPLGTGYDSLSTGDEITTRLNSSAALVSKRIVFLDSIQKKSFKKGFLIVLRRLVSTMETQSTASNIAETCPMAHSTMGTDFKCSAWTRST